MLGALRDGEALGQRFGVSDIYSLIERLPSDAVDIDISGDLDGLTDDLQDTAFRIVQEALTNAVRHGVPPARVRIQAAESGVHLRVSNSVAGGVVTSTRSRGLDGMRERAAAIGGTLSCGPSDDGWLVEADLRRSTS